MKDLKVNNQKEAEMYREIVLMLLQKEVKDLSRKLRNGNEELQEEVVNYSFDKLRKKSLTAKEKGAIFMADKIYNLLEKELEQIKVNKKLK